MSYLDGSIAVTTTGKAYLYKVLEYRCGYKQALADTMAAVRKESHLLVLDAWIEERLAAAICALEEK